MLKKEYLFTFTLALLLYAASFAQSGNRLVITEPVKYNDYIVEQQDLIGGKLLELVQILNKNESTQDDATASLEIVKATIVQALSNLSALVPLKDSGVKQDAADLFLFYQRTALTKYPPIIGQLYSGSPDFDEIDKLLSEITAEEKGYDEAFQQAQQKFADANNFTLEENELQKDINAN
jgi:hypothetical protein